MTTPASPEDGDADLTDDITADGIGGFTDIKNWAATGILAVASVVGAFNGLDELWKFPVASNEIPLRITAIVLFIILAILVIRWVIVTQYQLDMWKRWLNHPIAPAQTYSALCGLSIMLGILPVYAHRILIMSSIMTLYLTINLWTQWLSNVHFSRALSKTVHVPQNAVRARIHQSMVKFWIGRPQLPRILYMLLASVVALSLAAAGKCDTTEHQNSYYLAAYIVLILDIIVSEVIIVRWRIALDTEIARILRFAREERSRPNA
jgi:hypothetical protein